MGRPILVMITPDATGATYTATQTAPPLEARGTGPNPVAAFADLLAQVHEPGGTFMVVARTPGDSGSPRPGKGFNPPYMGRDLEGEDGG